MTSRPDDPPQDDREEQGVTEEFEAEFGDEFGADVADELAEQPAGNDETVEADVLALGDEEHAREERERAAQEAAAALEAQAGGEGDDGDEDGDEPAAAVEEEDEGEGEEAVEDEEEDEEAEEEEAPPGEPKPEPEAEKEPDEPPRVGLWARFLSASLVIVISMATATSVSILLYLSDLAKGLGGLPGVQDQITAVEGGDPQNILVLGSDHRPDIEEEGRSDTTMLLRIDPDNDAIALLSLPRDLRVNIPGRGIAKLNEAYTIGGPQKTLEVVKQLTGLNIHHVVNVDFEGFSQAINAIDCVYVDVDRQYFHSNEGLAVEDYFSEIDIQAGYQMLCGDRALQYVRYRHTDNDIVRAARQQDFLREARQKIGPSRLFRDREELIDIFKKYTTSDIDNEFTMLDVLKTFLGAADAPVKQIHFQGELGESYVTASNEQIQKAVDQFLGLKDTPGSLGEEGEGGGDGGGGGGDKPKEPKPESGGDEGPALIDSAGAGLAFAQQFAPAVGFPVDYPTKLVPGSEIIDESREYKIADEDGKVHRAYKLVFSIPATQIPLEFYGLMGTTWTDPPILENPSETREIGGREYDLFYDGDRLRMIAWRTNDAAYWLNNTLLQTLEDDEMIAIADSMDEVAPPKQKKKKPK
ncbi:MAG: LCP family protein [Solirubrobacterales bacterium]